MIAYCQNAWSSSAAMLKVRPLEAQAWAHVAGLAAAQLVQDARDGSPVQLTAAGEQARQL